MLLGHKRVVSVARHDAAARAGRQEVDALAVRGRDDGGNKRARPIVCAVERGVVLDRVRLDAQPTPVVVRVEHIRIRQQRWMIRREVNIKPGALTAWAVQVKAARDPLVLALLRVPLHTPAVR